MTPSPEPPVRKHRAGRVMTWRSRDSTAGVGARAAQIEALQRHAIVGRADHRSGAEQLVEPHLAVEDVAADEAKTPLEIERRVDLAADDRLGEARRMAFDRRDDRVRSGLAFLIPAPAGP